MQMPAIRAGGKARRWLADTLADTWTQCTNRGCDAPDLLTILQDCGLLDLQLLDLDLDMEADAP